jgi:thioredoxin 1
MTHSHPITVTDASFMADVLESTTPVLVDLWAQWCGPCRAVAPVLEQIASENVQRLTVAKLDVDANPLTAQQYQVVSIPTLIVFDDGQPVARIVGARGKSALRRCAGQSPHPGSPGRDRSVRPRTAPCVRR